MHVPSSDARSPIAHATVRVVDGMSESRTSLIQVSGFIPPMGIRQGAERDIGCATAMPRTLGTG